MRTSVDLCHRHTLENSQLLFFNWRSLLMLSACLPTFIIAILLMYKPCERKPAIYLGLSLIACVWMSMPQVIGFAGFYQVYPWLTFFPFPTELWLGPLLYLHTFTLLEARPLGWRKYLLLPGAMQSIYYSSAFLFLGDYKAKWAFNDAFHQPYIVPIESVLAVTSIGIALYKVWKLSQCYINYVENTESILTELEPVWLKRLVVIIAIALILFTGVEFTYIFVGLSYVSAFPVQVAIMLALAWLAFEANNRLVQVFPKLPSVDPSTVINETKHKNADASIQQLANEIHISVVEHRWFLQPRFSLKQLANEMATNEVYVSKALNQGLNLSFNDFINRLRVDYAKRLMKNDDTQMLAIALDSGFNSKATFNRVFKLHTGMTPTQFKSDSFQN